jgi:hypothetical protein
MIVLVSEWKRCIEPCGSAGSGVFDHLEKTKKPTTVIYDGAIGLAGI